MWQFFHNHKRGVLIGAITCFAVPFVFWGGSFGNMDSGAAGQLPESVALVGDIPISTQAFLNEYQTLVRTRSAGAEEPPTARELVEEGEIERILSRLVDSALLDNDVERGFLRPTDEYLAEVFKNSSTFLGTDGKFDPIEWNRFVENPNVNWNGLYNALTTQVNRVVHDRIGLASARVLTEDVRYDFDTTRTEIKVRYAPIEPKAELSEEEVRAFFDKDPDRFPSLPERKVDYISMSLIPPIPQLAHDLTERARGGEDFAKMATDLSIGVSRTSGGDIGWIIPTAVLPEYHKGIMDLAVGEVGEPVQGPRGVYIFKVEEERIDEVEDRRDVRVRELVVDNRLDDDEKRVRQDTMRALAEMIKADADVRGVAEQEGYEWKTTEFFTLMSQEIDGIDPDNAVPFRQAMSRLVLNQVSDMVETPTSLYVGKVIEVADEHPQTYEVARARVETQATAEYKASPEFKQLQDDLVAEISEKVTGLEEIATLFPDLEAEVQDSVFFKSGDFLFQQGIFWTPADVFNLFKDAELGTVAGPVTDFRGIPFLFELLDRNDIDAEAVEKRWALEEEDLRQARLQRAQFEHQQDLVQYLREQANSQFLIQQDSVALELALGLNQDVPADPATDETAPPTGDAPAATTDAPAPETADPSGTS